jgi:hypothetical protein
MQLQIPSSERKRLTALLSLPVAAFDALETAFADSSPTLRPQDLEQALLLPSDFDRSSLKDIVNVLLSFYWLRASSEVSPEEVANAVARAVNEDKELPAPAVGDVFAQRLAKLLSFDQSLGVTAKAKFVAYQNPRHFHSARIMTDARPVFLDASQSPAAFVILHTLKFDVHEGGDDREIFMSLDSEDLLELSKVIERAMNKEKGLRKSLERTGVYTLTRKDADADHR